MSGEDIHISRTLRYTIPANLQVLEVDDRFVGEVHEAGAWLLVRIISATHLNDKLIGKTRYYSRK